MQCSAVQCSAVQCSAVQCSAVKCSAVQCSAVQCSAVQCSVVVSTSAWLAGGPGSVPGHGMVFGVKTWLSTLGTCILHESENHVNVGPVLVWGITEPPRTVTVTTLSVSIDKSA